ncbi:hypothetical protein J2Z79_001433 [Symbiobacterium terraclitae]|uniref:Uncharacterized protein n=1 Tax=Symbiobacterium terraclitae TaxID=557451 RepID=A0ABS4JU95_9FIRM|nr:hypothetical protein [Symbiobacterium terraclitae]MBP2018034.1 hypothetical protein [Symbiobacterium terraclitae]
MLHAGGDPAVGDHPTHHLSEHELRALSLREFLDLVEADIRTLDERRRERQRRQAEASLPPLESLPLHAVSCCGKGLGSYPRAARVRCPFCGRWIAPGAAPGTPSGEA